MPVEIEDTVDGHKVRFKVKEVDGLSHETVEINLGDHDDAHLFAELIRRARSASITTPQ